MPRLLLLAPALLLAILAEAGKAEGGGRRRGQKRSGQRNGVAVPDCSEVPISPGHGEADIEVRLAGLTPSTAAKDIFLLWWSARASSVPYDPLAGQANGSVYEVSRAYPEPGTSEFNGGKVLVSETGQATLRIRTPSLHKMWLWVAKPHVHMQLCERSRSENDKSQKCRGARKKLVFGESGLEVKPDEDSVEILAAIHLTSPPSSPRTTMQAGGTNLTTTPAPARAISSTTSSHETILAPRTLDLDALEFSPVYNCLLEKELYDYFSGQCVEECRFGNVAEHGQCVRHERARKARIFGAAWQLSVDCSESCWLAMRNQSLHGARLGVAKHLGIPFQEVEVVFGFEESHIRRLEDGSPRKAFLEVNISTKRLSRSYGGTLLQSFGRNATTLTQILGITVLSAAQAPSAPAAPAQAPAPAPTWVGLATMSQRNDPYVAAYNAAEDRGPVAPPVSPVSSLPLPVLVASAAGVVAAAVALLILWKLRQRRTYMTAMAQAQQSNKQEMDLEKNDISAAKV